MEWRGRDGRQSSSMNPNDTTARGRIVWWYCVTIALVTLAIAGILRLGRSLPAPGAAAGGELSGTAGAGGEHSVWDAVRDGMAENFGHPLAHLLLQLLVIIAAARGAGALFRRWGQPAVVGEMAAGIMLGPSLFGALFPGAFAAVFPASSLDAIGLLSQVGVCLFMFSVGMELDPEHLKGRATAAVAVSHSGIVIPFLLGVVLAYFLYSSFAADGAAFTPFALFLGISMSITAFPVLARILQERGMTKTRLGGTAITCAAIGDVTAWVLLAFVVAAVGSLSAAGVALNLLLVAAFIAVMAGIVRKLLPMLLGDARMAQPDPSGGTLAAMVCVVMGSALCTEVMGIHALFGAFLAGVITPAAHGFREKLAVRIENFSTVLLLPLFFAFTGLRTQLGLVSGGSGWLICLLIIAVATTGKLGGSAITARIAGMSWRHSLQLGALMNTRGLMELIALNIGYDLGILSPGIFTMLVVMALATTVLTGPLLTLFGGSRQPPEGGATA